MHKKLSCYMRHKNYIFTWFCYVLTVIVISILAIENFVYSRDFGYLGFRKIDDIAFQHSIRQIHLNIWNGNLKPLFSLNDYAYGWVFWITISIVTFPFFLLSYIFQFDWPLIVAPRQISLAFAVSSMFLMRKIIRQFGAPEWGAAGAVLIFALLPTTGYFSLRFGTVNALIFFAMLTLFLATRDKSLDDKELTKIALSLAVTGAIKITGLLIAPLIIFLVLIRIEGPARTRVVLKSAIVFAPAFVLLMAPQLAYVIFKPDLLVRFLDHLMHFTQVTRVPSGAETSIGRLYDGAMGSPLVAIVYAVMFLGLLIGCVMDKIRRVQYLAILTTVILIALYLMTSVKNAQSMGSYFTCISFVLFLGLSFLFTKPGALFLASALIALLLADVGLRARSEYGNPGTSWSHLSYFAKQKHSSHHIEIAKETLACISDKKSPNQIEHIFMDYTVPSFINSLSWPQACVSIAWNNLTPQGKYCGKKIEFLVLDKKAVGYLPAYEFVHRVNGTNQVTADAYKLDRQSRELLEASGLFGDQSFTLLCDLGETRVYVHSDQN
jgi:hypothetical protein